MRIALASPLIQALADVAFLSDPWGLGWRIPVARVGSKAFERRQLARLRTDPLALKIAEIQRSRDNAAADRLLEAAVSAEAPAEAAPAAPADDLPPSPLPAAEEAQADPLSEAREQNAAYRQAIAGWYRTKREAEDALIAAGAMTIFDLRTRDDMLDKAVDLVLAGGDVLRAQKLLPDAWEGVLDLNGQPAPMTEANIRELLECDAPIDEGEGKGDEVGSWLVTAIHARANQVELYRLQTLERLEKNSERLDGGRSVEPISEAAES